MKNNKEIQIFCKNIKILREKNNLSQTKMAKKLGVTLKTLRSLENGAIPPRVTVKIFYNIHKNFDVPPKDQFDLLEK